MSKFDFFKTKYERVFQKSIRFQQFKPKLKHDFNMKNKYCQPFILVFNKCYLLWK